jgi:hypothetical protein
MQLPHVNTCMHSVTATAYFLLSNEIPQQRNILQIGHLTRYFVKPVMECLLDTVQYHCFFFYIKHILSMPNNPYARNENPVLQCTFPISKQQCYSLAQLELNMYAQQNGE